MHETNVVELYKMAWGLLLPFSVWLVLKLFSIEKNFAILKTESESREIHRLEMLDLIRQNHEAALENVKAMRSQLVEHNRMVTTRLNSIDEHLRNGRGNGRT